MLANHCSHTTAKATKCCIIDEVMRPDKDLGKKALLLDRQRPFTFPWTFTAEDS